MKSATGHSALSDTTRKEFWIAGDGIVTHCPDIQDIFNEVEEIELDDLRNGYIVHGNPVSLAMTAIKAGWRAKK